MGLLKNGSRLPPGFWSGGQLPLVLRVVIISVALVGNTVTAWRVLDSGPDGFGPLALELTLCVVDVLMWLVVALRPGWAWVPLVLLQALLVATQTQPGTFALEILIVVGFLAFAAVRHGLVIALVTTVAWTIVNPFLDHALSSSAFVSGYLAMLVLALVIGLSLRYLLATRAEDRRQIEEFDRRAGDLIQLQRDELARELHDIVAHDLTVIAMQSSAGAMQAPEGGAERETFEVIGDSARAALGDLRRLLRLMREPPSTDEVSSSAASIDLGSELADLAASLEDLGHPVTTAVSGDLSKVPFGVRTTMSRLLREGTTNILKHSTPSAAVRFEVAVDVEEGVVRADVVNALGQEQQRQPPRRFAVSRFGVIGLRERVQLLGGELDAGPTGEGGWRLAATLPLRADPH
ncbi:sensor histidine kinase [Ornithinicoccus hortensis]|uniref:histidine kinase n=1 Tax=Ornithinicoccus hortensis TaxID=82346 RepID=A0A542YWI6_9MICO|nr:histidine kinase [Ornithinicoccus hortensis]TQL52442.1 signal transduction histidine kinase [Ornithinicoccus hortensis]